MDFSVVFNENSLRLFGSGIVETLFLLVITLVLGFVAAIPLAVARVSRHKWLSWPVGAYTYVIRGTPMLLQLYIFYYGLAQFEFVRESFAWTWLSSATFCAIAAFFLNTCAYTVELFAGAFRNTNHGENEAAKAMGMSYSLMLRRIVIPSSLRRSLPSYSNEAIMMLHATSLASTVTLMDITAVATAIYGEYYLPFEPFIVAALIYMTLTFIMVRAFKLAERRWLAHLAPRKPSQAH